MVAFRIQILLLLVALLWLHFHHPPRIKDRGSLRVSCLTYRAKQIITWFRQPVSYDRFEKLTFLVVEKDRGCRFAILWSYRLTQPVCDELCKVCLCHFLVTWARSLQVSNSRTCDTLTFWRQMLFEDFHWWPISDRVRFHSRSRRVKQVVPADWWLLSYRYRSSGGVLLIRRRWPTNIYHFSTRALLGWLERFLHLSLLVRRFTSRHFSNVWNALIRVARRWNLGLMFLMVAVVSKALRHLALPVEYGHRLAARGRVGSHLSRHWRMRLLIVMMVMIC